ncbi:MAG: long-chain fatty acid--CoA ligase, partial [Desulfobulbaceae bacterium]|nr:long-chain fatty acid--CoA ligase [Desulfobulbaceae bacterium]
GKPYITAVVVLNFIAWKTLAEQLGLDPGELSSLRHPSAKREALARCERQTSFFPSYARVRNICLTLLPWTIENGLITPTLKTKRCEVQKRLAQQISDLYSGHHLP